MSQIITGVKVITTVRIAGNTQAMLSTLMLGLAMSSSTFSTMLAIGPFASGGRTPCPTDPVAHQIVQDTFKTPKPGDVILTPTGTERNWKELKPAADGWFSDGALSGGYTFCTYFSDKAKTMVLDASGHSMVYVNGVPRGGDPYGFGYVQLPVEIRKGQNEFLFSVGRGRVRAQLVKTPSEVTITSLDPTFPDAIVGEDNKLLCSVLVMNATNKVYNGKVSGAIEGTSGGEYPFHITPMTVKKISFLTKGFEVLEPRKLKLSVALSGSLKPSTEFEIEAKLPTQMHKRTFQSNIDGSVQYYAVQPASQPGAKAMVVSLHGASVEATSQAASYGQKPWCNIVCPTNGRPYGFDWEDWGRITTMEALEDAKHIYKPDEDRIYLTGHSMGGHGTWSIGFNHPGKFAAIAPCAGWISFWSYGGAGDWKDPDPVEKLLRRAANASDTLKLIDNARGLGIFIQHGEADDNVPVAQAREMRKRLAEFHRDFDWHEEPGQSHWFDTDPEPGANVQDYAPLFDFLSRHRIQNEADKRIWDVTSVNPDGDTSAANVTILARERSMEPSRLEVRTWADGTYEEIKTTNVKVLSLGRLVGQEKFKAKIDGFEVSVDAKDFQNPFFDNHFVKKDDQWTPQNSTDGFKQVRFEGGIKACFSNRVTCVYGTKGTKKERDWAYNKARYDAETWWYRGNGSLHLTSDSYMPPVSGPPLSMVFYGNLRTNAALGRQLKFSNGVPAFPGSAEGLEFSLGHRHFKGDFGLIWAGGAQNLAHFGVIGGTTLKGCRAIERIPIFLSGAHFPEVFVNTPEMYLNGSKGVVAVGFYGNDWSVENGDFAFRD